MSFKERDKFNEALKRAQEEFERKSEKAVPPLNGKYVAPIIPQKAEAERNGIDARLIAYTDPKSPVAEQYRSLATHILSAPGAKELKVLAITSSSIKEGKTLTALNLAVVLAQDLEKRVLIVDCNFRRPAVDLYLNVISQTGLSDALAGTISVKKVVMETHIERMFCIYAGKTEISPTELLSSSKMGETLAILKENFDYIILDTPAVIPYADPRLISKVSDGVLLIVKAEKTRREVVSRAESFLKEVGAKIIGVVLTNIQYHIPEYIHKHL